MSVARFQPSCWSFFFALIFLVSPLMASATVVGSTAGSFSVDGNGGAEYTIPIVSPPGTAGMSPSVALSYTKSVSNPIVGVGFFISGLSVIQRCGKTNALDGAKGGVNYDSNDRFLYGRSALSRD
jgi:hypothetical protein